MKKNCNIIKDLMPLYIDLVCSLDTKILVEEHLKTCIDCREFKDNLKENIKHEKNKKFNEIEIIKKFSKKINFKIIKIVIIAIFVIGISTFYFLKFLGTYKINMEYNENIKISLYGTEKKWNLNVCAPYGYSYGTNISSIENGEVVNNIFVTIKHNLYEKITYKQGLICSAPDLNYPNISLKDKIKVYYTTYDLKEIKNPTSKELEQITNNSHLIFTNELETTTINCTLNNNNYWYSLTYYKLNKQIISGENISREINDERIEGLMPEELLIDVYSNKHRKAVYFPHDNATEIFNKTKNYFQENRGSCTLN